MSVRVRTLLVTGLAVAGLALGLGTASADEPDRGSGNPLGDVADTVNDVTGPLVPQEIDDLIAGLYY